MSARKAAKAHHRIREGKQAKAPVIMEQGEAGWTESPLRAAMKRVETIQLEAAEFKEQTEAHRHNIASLEALLSEAHSRLCDSQGLLTATEQRLSRAMEKLRNETYKIESTHHSHGMECAEQSSKCLSTKAGRYG